MTVEETEDCQGAINVGTVPSAGPSRPRKKSTIDEMREDLEKLGLDTKGKKETLWK